ncbi:MAG: cobaltochelatase subunit CobN, partial [Pseudoalteromonas distincta]
ADELRARYLNPQWINAMQGEGYAGTLEVLNVTNNLFGWQAMDASTVRDDQWQAMFDTYVTDTRDLGTREWFEQHNPTAQAQMLERMAEAMRKGYWDASEQTREELAERWQTLQDDFAVEAGSQVTRDFIAELAQGFGLDAGPADVASAAATEPATPTNTQAAEQPLEQIQGQMLEPVAPPPAQDNTLQLWVMVMMLLLIGSGALWQSLRNRRSRCEHLIIQ